MDAPQISTLPEEKSPPPRRKLMARGGLDHLSVKPKLAEYASWRQRQTTVTKGSDDEEEEEDQLIDDEDDVSGSKRKSAPTAVSAAKKKAPAKRKARKEPEAEEDGLKKRTKKDKALHPGKSALVAPGLEATPSDSHDDGTGFNTGANTPSIAAADSEPPESISASKAPKKKGTPRKAAPKTGKGKPSGCVSGQFIFHFLTYKEFIWQTQDGYPRVVRHCARRHGKRDERRRFVHFVFVALMLIEN